MSELEKDKCNGCGKISIVRRKYFYYSVKCDCCVGDKHFEIMRFCDECKDRPPAQVRIVLEITPDKSKKELLTSS